MPSILSSGPASNENRVDNSPPPPSDMWSQESAMTRYVMLAQLCDALQIYGRSISANAEWFFCCPGCRETALDYGFHNDKRLTVLGLLADELASVQGSVPGDYRIPTMECEINDIIEYYALLSSEIVSSASRRRQIGDMVQIALMINQFLTQNYSLANVLATLRGLELGPGTFNMQTLYHNAIDSSLSPSAVQTIIARPSKVGISAEKAAQKHDFCPICHEEFGSSDDAAAVCPLACCDKPFHVDCLIEYFGADLCGDCHNLHEAKCPLCRKGFPVGFIVSVINLQNQELRTKLSKLPKEEIQEEENQDSRDDTNKGTETSADLPSELMSKVMELEGLALEDWEAHWESERKIYEDSKDGEDGDDNDNDEDEDHEKDGYTKRDEEELNGDD